MPLALSSQTRTADYSDYLNSVSSLIGVEIADLQTSELAILNTYFNRAKRKIWEMSNWVDICRYGEARFPTNLITYPNDQTQTAYWTATNATVAAQAVANPLDNRVTACKITETSATGTHGVSQAASFIPYYPYAVSAYVRPAGRTWAYLNVSDGSSSYTTFFNLVQNATVGTVTGTGCTAAVQSVANGFYLISMAFTASASAGTGSIGLQTATSGTVLSFAGNSALGLYTWGVTGSQTANGLPQTFTIPWVQLGENPIDAGGLFDCWPNNPLVTVPTARWTYKPTADGINLIGCLQANPAFLYYRFAQPVFQGSTYSSSSTYAAGVTVYFTNSSSVSNYYTSLTAITAGQSPEASPTLWQVMQIPYVFFEYIVYNSYGDWLQVEGQAAKAGMMYQYAQSCIDDEADKQERQLGDIMPVRVYTHNTSQQRGGGYTGTTLITNPNAQ